VAMKTTKERYHVYKHGKHIRHPAMKKMSKWKWAKFFLLMIEGTILSWNINIWELLVWNSHFHEF
jgi:hypothetical protein